MDENNKNASELDPIIEVQNRLLAADFDLYTFMDLVVEQMQIITPATGVVIELVDGNEMVYRAATGTVKDYLGLRLPLSNSISGLCVSSHEVLRSDDTEVDPRVNLEACRKVKARSMIVAPLFNNGNTIGVLKILSSSPSAFSEKDVKTLQMMAGMVACAIANQMRQELRDFI